MSPNGHARQAVLPPDASDVQVMDADLRAARQRAAQENVERSVATFRRAQWGMTLVLGVSVLGLLTTIVMVWSGHQTWIPALVVWAVVLGMGIGYRRTLQAELRMTRLLRDILVSLHETVEDPEGG